MNNQETPLENEPVKCAGKMRNSSPCRYYALPGEKFCGRYKHNNVPKAANHSNYKSAGWSKYLPQEMIDKAKELFDNPDWQTLVQEIIYLNVRLSQLSEMLDAADEGKGYPLDRWKDFKAAFSDLKRALHEGDKGKADVWEAINRADWLIKSCQEEEQIHLKMERLFGQKASLIIQQENIEAKRKMFVRLDEIMLWQAALYTGIDLILPDKNEMVNSREVRQMLAQHLRRVFNLKTSPRAEMQQNQKELSAGELADQEEETDFIDGEFTDDDDRKGDDSP